jgi:YtkA-like protein
MTIATSRRRFAFAAAAFLAADIAAAGWLRPAQATATPQRDYASERLSEQGAYRVYYKTDGAVIPIKQLHSWTLHIARPDGTPVTDATVAVDGDMPEHRHGLPTRPRVTRHLGNGDYLVEGVKFQMGGWWVMEFTIASGGRSDIARFNLQLQK